MNSLLLISLGILLFGWAYKFYARKMESLFGINPNRPTPAVTKYDGIDFVPAKNWLVLFGHHFSSIAGAGPIIGPVIACALWGWLPALIWIIFGSIFIGGIHDFGSLVCSIRNNGSSIADISKTIISKKAKIILSLFIWLALILVIAVFTYLCADTFVKEPKIVLPSLGLIPAAMLVGYLLYNLKADTIKSTILGLGLLIILIFGGNFLPVKLANHSLWIIVLLIYCFLASVMPVHILLQPRDYLSSFLLYAGVIFGFAGIFISHPQLNQPAFVAVNSQEGPLWPMLCVTVACGAVSGFHSLIASGTTSKQIANERQAKGIGYGGMLIEGLIAIMALTVVCAGIKSSNITNLISQSGPINIFAQGYAQITKKVLSGYGGFIALTILNAFILTTLDTATRITRYITEELLGIKNRYAATLLVVILAGSLALTGAWQKIWPVFGSSNQLVASLVLLVISLWLLKSKKPMLFTLIPAIFMFITAIWALIFQGQKYIQSRNYLLFSISFLLVALALFLLVEAIKSLYRKDKSQE